MLQIAAKQTLSTLNALRLLLSGMGSPSSTADACVSSGRRQLSSYSLSVDIYSHYRSTLAWLLSSVVLWYIACLTSRNIIDAQHCLSLTVMLVQVAMPVPTAQPVLFTLKQLFGREGIILLLAGVITAVHNLEVCFNAASPGRHTDACTMAGQPRLLECPNLAQV